MIVQALKPHIFAGRQRRAGDEYEATKADLRILRALGWAEEVPSAVYMTRVMVPDVAPMPRVKRKYTKRKKTDE